MAGTAPARGPEAGLTVVVPVYQGERQLPSTLAAVARQRVDATVRVVVVCNGCVDGSVEAARAWSGAFEDLGHDYHVLSLPHASRPAALNAAERLASGARVYLDHDAVISEGGLQALLDALDGSCHFATLRSGHADPVPRLVAWYFRAWHQVPYVRASPVTMGLYAVSAQGRARWGEMPSLHSDDKFARLHFQPHERRLLEAHTYRVSAPSSLRALVRARSRYTRGNRELARRYPHLAGCDVPRHRGMQRFLASPAGWWRLALLLAVQAAASMHAIVPARRAGMPAPPAGTP